MENDQELLERAAKERREIVARYDKVRIICFVCLLQFDSFKAKIDTPLLLL